MSGWKLFIGHVSIVAGVAVLMYPLAAADSLSRVFTMMLSIWGLLQGIMMLFLAFNGGGWGVGVLGVLGIIRAPEDSLNPGHQIWTYYTHMANTQGDSFISMQFPPGNCEVFVEAGTLLGYQDNFQGNPGNLIWNNIDCKIFSK